MEKILVALNAGDINSQSVEFGCYLAELTHSAIAAVLLSDNTVSVNHPAPVSGLQPEFSFSERQDEFALNAGELYKQCAQKGIRCSIHANNDDPLSELINESRFADVIVIDAALTTSAFDGRPSRFVNRLLKDADCPVIIAPENFQPVSEIVFTYNDSRSAIYAIKQFTYLFPALTDMKATVLYINDSGKWNDAQKNKLQTWMQNHYSVIGYETLSGNVDDRMFEYLRSRRNIFLVMGGYGRSSLSRILDDSTTELMVRLLSCPVFIAHQ